MNKSVCNFAIFLFTLLLLMGFNFSSFGDTRKSDLYILCVGIEPDLTKKGKRDWYAKDAEYMCKALETAKSLYKKTHSRVINGKNATPSNVLGGLRWISENTGKDDIAVVFFSAHGDMDKKSGYWASLFPAPMEKGNDYIWGKDINRILSKTAGKVILMMDTCCSGGIIPKNSKQENIAYILACREEESSDGQWLRKDIPHGYFVISVCEALSGLADKNSDRKVTLKELTDYLPLRAKAMYKKQNAVIHLPDNFKSIPLVKKDSRRRNKQLWQIDGNNLPSDYNQLNCEGNDVDKFASKAKLTGGKTDKNAKTWNSKRLKAKRNSIDGNWESRWNDNSSPDEWAQGTAEVTSSGNRVHILYKDTSGGNYLITTVRETDYSERTIL
jgi:hypothetical protein